MEKNITAKSTCCFAKFRVAGTITKYAICCKCGKPCSITFIPRRKWQRNPATQVQPNKKRKKIEKQIKKEVQDDTD